MKYAMPYTSQMIDDLRDAGLPVEFVAGERVEFSRLLSKDEAETYRAILRKRKGPTKRQLELLALAAQGETNKAIAMRLGIKEQTVKNTFCDLYRRLGAYNRAHALSLIRGAKL